MRGSFFGSKPQSSKDALGVMKFQSDPGTQAMYARRYGQPSKRKKSYGGVKVRSRKHRGTRKGMRRKTARRAYIKPKKSRKHRKH